MTDVVIQVRVAFKRALRGAFCHGQLSPRALEHAGNQCTLEERAMGRCTLAACHIDEAMQ